jgi:hypothetical protein
MHIILTGVWNLTAGMDWGEMKNLSSPMGKPCVQILFSRYIFIDSKGCVKQGSS